MNEKIRKFIAPFLMLASLSLFIASTVVFFVNRGSTKYYSLSHECYENISSYAMFQKGIKDRIGVEIDDMYIVNAGEIKTDSNGNVVSLNVDCEYKQEEKAYSLQIKSIDTSEYKLITSKSNGLNTNKISLKDALYALSFYDFNSKANDLDYKFLMNDELINNIALNDKPAKQYVVYENSISEVKSDLKGVFSRIMILSNDSFEELYYQI